MSHITLTEEQTDDLLYCARVGETQDLEAYLDEIVQATPAEQRVDAKREVIEKVADQAGNSMAHYACANGHLATFQILSPLLTLASALRQNTSGNTPLHWAGLNGHLPLVKALVGRIEDLEKEKPEEARKINVLKHEQEAADKKKRAAKQQHSERAQGEVDAKPSQESLSQPSNGPTSDDAVAEDSEEPERSLWDIRNHFGRGPTSESQMNDREDVVQYLLACMAGGSSAAADPPAQSTQERVDEEADTPAPSASSEAEVDTATQGAAALSVSKD